MYAAARAKILEVPALSPLPAATPSQLLTPSASGAARLPPAPSAGKRALDHLSLERTSRRSTRSHQETLTFQDIAECVIVAAVRSFPRRNRPPLRPNAQISLLPGY